MLGGLYTYIINNFDKEDIKLLANALDKFYISDEKTEFSRPYNVILDLALKEEIKIALDNIEDEKLVKMSDEEYEKLVNYILEGLVNLTELWGDIYNYISMKKDEYFNEKEQEQWIDT